MNIEKKSAFYGAIAVLTILIVFYAGFNIYMAGGSGVSRGSACAEMRATIRKSQEVLEDNPGSRQLIKALANLNNVYADTCL